MTQQKREALTSGQVGPKLQGLGLTPTSMIFHGLAGGQIVKNRECIDTRIACRFAEPLKAFKISVIFIVND